MLCQVWKDLICRKPQRSLTEILISLCCWQQKARNLCQDWKHRFAGACSTWKNSHQSSHSGWFSSVSIVPSCRRKPVVIWKKKNWMVCLSWTRWRSLPFPWCKYKSMHSFNSVFICSLPNVTATLELKLNGNSCVRVNTFLGCNDEHWYCAVNIVIYLDLSERIMYFNQSDIYRCTSLFCHSWPFCFQPCAGVGRAQRKDQTWRGFKSWNTD